MQKCMLLFVALFQTYCDSLMTVPQSVSLNTNQDGCTDLEVRLYPPPIFMENDQYIYQKMPSSSFSFEVKATTNEISRLNEVFLGFNISNMFFEIIFGRSSSTLVRSNGETLGTFPSLMLSPGEWTTFWVDLREQSTLKFGQGIIIGQDVIINFSDVRVEGEFSHLGLKFKGGYFQKVGWLPPKKTSKSGNECGLWSAASGTLFCDF